MVEFRVGDTVELISNVGMGAPKGSLATVKKMPGGLNKWIIVEWLGGDHEQQDGGYDSNRFVLADRSMEDTREYLEAVTK